MFTAGTRPASTVRASSDSKPGQSTAPSARERQQHRRDPEDRAARSQRGRARSSLRHPPRRGERVEPVEQRRSRARAHARAATAAASCDAPTAHASQCVTRPARSTSSAGTMVCGCMMLAFGLSAITARRRASDDRRSASVDDRRRPPRGRRTTPRPARDRRAPAARSPPAPTGARIRSRDSASSRSVAMRWTRTCQGAPPASAVSMRTPGMRRPPGERDAVGDLAEHARRRGRGGRRWPGRSPPASSRWRRVRTW